MKNSIKIPSKIMQIHRSDRVSQTFPIWPSVHQLPQLLKITAAHFGLFGMLGVFPSRIPQVERLNFNRCSDWLRQPLGGCFKRDAEF